MTSGFPENKPKKKVVGTLTVKVKIIRPIPRPIIVVPTPAIWMLAHELPPVIKFPMRAKNLAMVVNIHSSLKAATYKSLLHGRKISGFLIQPTAVRKQGPRVKRLIEKEVQKQTNPKKTIARANKAIIAAHIAMQPLSRLIPAKAGTKASRVSNSQI
jgi:hypothetical protein